LEGLFLFLRLMQPIDEEAFVKRKEEKANAGKSCVQTKVEYTHKTGYFFSSF